MAGARSHVHGTAGACAVIMRLTCAQAFARAAGSMSAFARSIARLIAGSFSSGQLVLLAGLMLRPSKVGRSIVEASAKSRFQPTFAQIAVSEAGRPQNFENIVGPLNSRRR